MSFKNQKSGGPAPLSPPFVLPSYVESAVPFFCVGGAALFAPSLFRADLMRRDLYDPAAIGSSSWVDLCQFEARIHHSHSGKGQC